MKYNKQPIDIPTQIAMLKARGLIFANEQKAQQMLATVSYFRLAAFLRPMEADKTTHQYKPNATFEKAVHYMILMLNCVNLYSMALVELKLRYAPK